MRSSPSSCEIYMVIRSDILVYLLLLRPTRHQQSFKKGRKTEAFLQKKEKERKFFSAIQASKGKREEGKGTSEEESCDILPWIIAREGGR